MYAEVLKLLLEMKKLLQKMEEEGLEYEEIARKFNEIREDLGKWWAQNPRIFQAS